MKRANNAGQNQPFYKQPDYQGLEHKPDPHRNPLDYKETLSPSFDVVGYRHPPTEQQFKKGKSGNPKGRPPKLGRVLSDRQGRRDTLALLEKEILVQDASGTRKVPVIEAILLSMVKKALNNHGPSQRFLIKRWDDFIKLHMEAYPKQYETLELFEYFFHIGEGAGEYTKKRLREFRALTREMV